MGAALFVELSIAVLGSSLLALGTHGPDVKAGFGDPAAIGHLLLERFLLAFEASSILLLLAAVGAVVLAGRRRDGKDAGGPSERFAREEDGPSGASNPTQQRRVASEEGLPVAFPTGDPA
ncbi:MAG: NADH-quinone oxidoreductase subunit J [Vicinamibacteria bacterium]